MAGRSYGALCRAGVAVALFAVAGVSLGATPAWVKVETIGTGTSTWKKVCVADGAPGTWRKAVPCIVPVVNCTISTNIQNYNIFTQCAGSPATAKAVTLTINAGVHVTAATLSPALDTGTGWPAGSTITGNIGTNAYIIGKGGAGGGGGSLASGGRGGTGFQGGTAFNAQYAVSVVNNGVVAGGGGGGGGDGWRNDGYYGGDGGGGGAGYGPGGPAGMGSTLPGNDGQNGFEMTGGGNGGGLGGYGSWGNGCTYSTYPCDGGPGGPGGAAVSGKSYVNGGSGLLGTVYGLQN